MSQHVENQDQLAIFPENAIPPIALAAARVAQFPFFAIPYAVKAFDALQNIVRIAETMRTLMDMSDRELAQKGIERADIGELAAAIIDGNEAEFWASRRQAAAPAEEVVDAPELPLAA